MFFIKKKIKCIRREGLSKNDNKIKKSYSKIVKTYIIIFVNDITKKY